MMPCCVRERSGRALDLNIQDQIRLQDRTDLSDSGLDFVFLLFTMNNIHGAPRSRGLLSIFVNSVSSTFSLREPLELIVKIVVDTITAVLLAMSFLVQTLSLLVSLDFALKVFWRTFVVFIAFLIAPMLFLVPTALERRAVSSSILNYFLNILWTQQLYEMDAALFDHLLHLPVACLYLLLGGGVAWAATFIQTKNHENCPNARLILSVLVLALGTMAAVSVRTAPASNGVMMMLILLRPSIEQLCRAGHVLVITETENDGGLSKSIMEMLLHMIWAILELAYLMTHRHSARWRFFRLFHLVLDLAIPVRNVVIKIMNRRYIDKRFPRVTEAELQELQNDSCPVCLSAHDSCSVRLPCQHCLHSHCLTKVLEQGSSIRPSRCPMCRACLVPEEVPAPNNNVLQVRILSGGSIHNLRNGINNIANTTNNGTHANAPSSNPILSGTGTVLRDRLISNIGRQVRNRASGRSVGEDRVTFGGSLGLPTRSGGASSLSSANTSSSSTATNMQADQAQRVQYVHWNGRSSSAWADMPLEAFIGMMAADVEQAEEEQAREQQQQHRVRQELPQSVSLSDNAVSDSSEPSLSRKPSAAVTDSHIENENLAVERQSASSSLAANIPASAPSRRRRRKLEEIVVENRDGDNREDSVSSARVTRSAAKRHKSS